MDGYDIKRVRCYSLLSENVGERKLTEPVIVLKINLVFQLIHPSLCTMPLSDVVTFSSTSFSDLYSFKVPQ